MPMVVFELAYVARLATELPGLAIVYTSTLIYALHVRVAHAPPRLAIVVVRFPLCLPTDKPRLICVPSSARARTRTETEMLRFHTSACACAIATSEREKGLPCNVSLM
jgi:hypothetical protein